MPVNKSLKAVLFLVASAILTRLIPFSSWFRTLDTMIHEFGHAVVTLLLSGRVLRIELNADHSGTTYSYLSSGWSSVLVSLSGYTIASIFAVLLFYGYAKRKQAAGLILITLLAAVNLLFFVRNSYGVWWLVIFMALNIVFYLLGSTVRNFYYLLLAFLCLEESVVGPLTLAITSLTNPRQAGDAANLAHMTVLPAIAWSMLFLLFALWCTTQSLTLFWRKPARKPAANTSMRTG